MREPQRFDVAHTLIEGNLRRMNSPIGSVLAYEHSRAIRDMEDAVTAAGFQFYGDRVVVEIRLAYDATVCACGIDVRGDDPHRDGCPSSEPGGAT